MAKLDEIVPGSVAVAEQNTATIVQNADEAKKVGGKTEYVVRAKDVVKIFKMGNEDVHALKGISIDIKRGE